MAAGRNVSFRASDGRTVSALAFEPSQHPSPAVILVPMLGRPKEDWDAVGQRLADANILALAIDLGSLSEPGDSKVLAGWSGDVRAAVAYLSSRPDVRPSAIGVAGASLGASLGAIAAAGDPSVRSLVLISPALDYRGLRIEAAMKQYGARPALLIASAHDPYAARSVRELAKDTAGRRETRFSDITAHGTVLLARDGDTVRALIEWFQGTLGFGP
jgi:dienelactone hydrolase